MKKLFWIALSLACANFLIFSHGCTSKSSAPSKKTVNLAIWSNYLSLEIISDFEKKTGIHVQTSNYSSNEELLAKLQAGASGYDLVVPSDYMVFAMSELGLLHELDHSKIPNEKSLDPRWLKKPYDPTNRFSLPYDWGTTGLAVNRSLYKGEVKGFKNLFNNPDLAGKFTLLDDVRETIGMALKIQGASLNSKNPADIARAKELILKNRSKIKGFTSEPLMPMVNGETAVAHIYMSDALQARRNTGGKVEYVLPEEGGTLWVDNLVIPKGAQNVEEAHALLNFLIEAHSNAATTQQVLVSPANREAFALLPKDIQSNTVLFPAEGALKKFEMIQDLGEALKVWDRAWTEIKAQ